MAAGAGGGSDSGSSSGPPIGAAVVSPYPDLPAFFQPTKLLQAPADDSRWYVLEKGGTVRVFDNHPAPGLAPTHRAAGADVAGARLPGPERQPLLQQPDLRARGGAGDCPEIYAWGFRNPWRWSFDRATGALWAGDVGQNLWKEIDMVQRGRDYGWDCREGGHDFEPANCPMGGLVEPVSEYGHALGISVTGGYVCRGSAIPNLTGRYVFGDFGSGRIWALRSNGQGGFQRDELLDTGYNIVAFAEDQSGELYFLHYGGQVLKLEDAPPGAPTNVP